MEFKSSEEDGTSGNIVNYFNKAERFHDFQDLPVIGRVTLWDMVNDFGYTRTDDGTVEVYHKGTHWYGPWPMRLFFAIHGKYAIWATEKYVNSPHFGDSDKLEEAAAVRHFVPGTFRISINYFQYIIFNKSRRCPIVALQQQRFQMSVTN